MNYHVVVGNSPSDLEQQVNRLIQDGWTPTGGLAISIPVSVHLNFLVNVTETENRLIYCQAMVKGK
jgi:hypothetical protein